jgi:hypothetical protein
MLVWVKLTDCFKTLMGSSPPNYRRTCPLIMPINHLLIANQKLLLKKCRWFRASS